MLRKSTDYSRILLLALATGWLCAALPDSLGLSEAVIDQATLRYGPVARNRLIAWRDLVAQNRQATEQDKLRLVNDFFNQIRFVSDQTHWSQTDYWATPIEFLGTNGGDCEDFSIAKYFTLRALGVAESKLQITYVNAVELQQAHMVVTYFSTPAAEPLVLDNLNRLIKPASQRPDLLPVYSFNGEGLWLSKERGRGERVGTSKRLKSWREVLNRMNRQ
ncbi:MAG: transglutaminase-like cysteine peptidase [Gammaproteobacteria bacterium]|nr:transglutaminase-like cysteine peptidase [Gammaproteobacteria bacterium]